MNTESIQAAVSKTLFIPLAARALEAKREDSVLLDEKAVEIMAQVEVGDTILDGGSISTHGILARTKVIDDEVRKILSDKPDSIIINLGAGLDTRICRIDNGHLSCFELDLPDVITLRRRFFTENERVHFISKSVLDDDWICELGGIKGENIIIIAEGLLMYFSEKDVQQIFRLLAGHFKGADMYFDVVHSFFVSKGISSTFLWGLDKAKDIEKLNPGIRIVKSWSIGNMLKSRQSRLYRIMNILPSTKNRSQILHIQI